MPHRKPMLALALSALAVGCASSHETEASSPARTDASTRTAPDASATDTGVPDASSAAATAADERDPAAIAALSRMGAFLRGQEDFRVRSQTQTEEVLESGQRIRLSSTATLDVHRPDGLHANVVSNRRRREFFYDGETFTISAPRMGYYATVPAPATLGELNDFASERYGIELPLADLFLWGTERDDLSAITSAIDVGPSTLSGVETEHYAYRQPGLDWEIWIQTGDQPLPRMLSLITTDDDARPEHSAVYDWDLNPRHTPRTFAFTPTESSRRIAIADSMGTGAAE